MHASTFNPRINNRVFAALCCVLLLLTSSCHSSKMDMAEFSRLKPFKGRVTKVENIGFPEQPTSISGPDYRVTVLRADGTVIIIPIIHTTWLTNTRLEKLEKKECDLPKELVEC